MAQDNYTTAQNVLDYLHKSTLRATDIKPAWLNWVDALIDQHTGYSFKGAPRTYSAYGAGTRLILLPSRAASITRITQEGPDGESTDFSAADYSHSGGSRFIERRNTATDSYYNGYGYGARGTWLKDHKYIVEYVEPLTPPDTYEGVATECVAKVYLFAEKNGEVGLALNTSESGSLGGKLSGASNQTYPARLYEDIMATIRIAIRKPTI